MGELVDEGKVRWIGVCNFDVEQLRSCEAIRHVDSVQPPLSLLARGARTNCHPVGAVYGDRRASPTCRWLSGLLTGSFDARRHRPASTRTTGAGTPRRSPEPLLAANLALVERLHPLAERIGPTSPALALAWALALPGVTAAIVGARLPRHIDGWLPGGELELGERDLREIAEAIADTGAGSDAPPKPPPHMRPAAS